MLDFTVLLNVLSHGIPEAWNEEEEGVLLIVNEQIRMCSLVTRLHSRGFHTKSVQNS